MSTSETSLTLALAPLVDAGTLVHGHHYTIVVIATSHAGLASEVSARFIADLLPPSVAVIADGPTVVADAGCASSAEAVTCSWAGVRDDLSGVASIEWALGTQPRIDDVYPLAYDG